MKRLALVFLLLVVPACASIDAETPEQKLVVAETSFQAALVTITRLADAGMITTDNAREVQAGREAAFSALQAARTSFDAGLPTAGALIGAANAAVLNLDSILKILEEPT